MIIPLMRTANPPALAFPFIGQRPLSFLSAVLTRLRQFHPQLLIFSKNSFQHSLGTLLVDPWCKRVTLLASAHVSKLCLKLSDLSSSAVFSL